MKVRKSGELHEGRRTILVCLILVLVTAALYLPVARHQFINFDDPDYVTGNPYVQAGLRFESIHWAFTGVYSSNWHPVTWMSHMLDCEVYGVKPAGHHITNLVLHLANVLLVFFLLRGMTSAFWRSAFVAALFAVHPLHVESVAWVAERKDVLSAFFGLLCLVAYVKYVRKKFEINPKFEIRGWIYYALALALFALGLMSKPMLVTWPFVMLLLDYWPLGRIKVQGPKSQVEGERQEAGADGGSTVENSAGDFRRWLAVVLEKVPFFALSVGSCVVTVLAQRACGAMVPLTDTPVAARIANSLVSYVRYVSKTFWPAKLAIFYPYEQLSWESEEVLAALFIMLALTGFAVWAWKRKPYWPVGWFWFIGVLVPVIGVVQVGKQALADRYTYLPHIGLFVIIAWGFAWLLARIQWPRWVGAGIGGLVLVVLTILTSHQLTYWRNTKTLFEHAIAVTTHNYVAYTVLASELVESNKLSEAEEDCRLALQYSSGYPDAYNTLGAIYARVGKYEEAIASYKQASAYDPNYGEPCYGMANVFLKQKNYAEAELQAREALRRSPTHIPSLYCLATALHNEGKLDEAADYYSRLIRMNPELFSPHRLLGNVLVTQGKSEEAIKQYRMAVKIRPEDADTHALIGLLLLNRNQVDEAEKELLRATQIQPTNAAANYQLALVCEGRKEAQKAIEYYHKAIEAQPDLTEALNNLAWMLAANHEPALRNGTEAVSLAERACKLSDYKAAVFVGTLGAAYAEAGRFGEAVTAAEKARDLALAAGQKIIAAKNTELLELYRAGHAYHEAE